MNKSKGSCGILGLIAVFVVGVAGGWLAIEMIMSNDLQTESPKKEFPGIDIERELDQRQDPKYAFFLGLESSGVSTIG